MSQLTNPSRLEQDIEDPDLVTVQPVAAAEDGLTGAVGEEVAETDSQYSDEEPMSFPLNATEAKRQQTARFKSW